MVHAPHSTEHTHVEEGWSVGNIYWVRSKELSIHTCWFSFRHYLRKCLWLVEREGSHIILFFHSDRSRWLRFSPSNRIVCGWQLLNIIVEYRNTTWSHEAKILRQNNGSSSIDFVLNDDNNKIDKIRLQQLAPSVTFSRRNCVNYFRLILQCAVQTSSYIL